MGIEPQIKHVHYVFTRRLLSATSPFDGNTTLIGNATGFP
jgi:hypothetical protein